VYEYIYVKTVCCCTTNWRRKGDWSTFLPQYVYVL
jgi:hypothetical protein